MMHPNTVCWPQHGSTTKIPLATFSSPYHQMVLVAPFQFPFGLPIVSDDPWIYFPIQVARCWVGTAAGNDTRLLKSGTVLVQSPADSLRDGCSQRQNSTASGRRKVAVEEYPRTWD